MFLGFRVLQSRVGCRVADLIRTEGESYSILGGSWAVISRVKSPSMGYKLMVTLRITPLPTTHEPPRRVCRLHGSFELRCCVSLGFIGFGFKARV